MKKIWKSVKVSSYLVFLLGLILTSFNGVFVAEMIKRVGQFKSNSTPREIITFTLGSLGAWILIFFGIYLAGVMQASILRQINVFLKRQVARQQLRQPQNPKVTGTISFISNDLNLLVNNYFEPIFNIVSNIGTLTVSVIYMVSIDPLIALLYIAMGFTILIPEQLAKKRLNQAGANFSLQKQTYLDYLKDILSGSTTLKANQALRVGETKLQSTLKSSEAAQYQMDKLTTKVSFFTHILSGINFILPFGIGLLVISQTHSLSIPSLIAIFLASNQVFNPLMYTVSYFNQITTTKDVRTKVEAIIQDNSTTSWPEAAESTDFSVENRSPFKTLSIKKVTKSFADKVVLNQFSLVVHPHDRILITGKSGAGKSTIFNLLMGVFKPDQGTIDLDEHPLTDPQIFGIIHQQPYIFNQTIAYNLALGQAISRQALLAALDTVQLTTELGADPLTYQAGESGANLSGGQIARIEIARNILRKKPILLVDEVTASLDDQSATHVRKILYALDVAIIEIAHHYNKNGQQANFQQVELINGQAKLIDQTERPT